ncbi:MAG: aspartate-semialdehyde dehydrogenase [Euryarchaeota archaeon]|nr:aspartate-semialdehyde dehydrogenase [Euryarchaeota archaeon]
MKKISVAILGATGMIGQRFVQLLEDHPYFELSGLYASERSDGKQLHETLKIRDHQFTEDSLNMRISAINIEEIAHTSRVAFSGLPSDIAGNIETELANAGVAVFSNASNHRMNDDVPLLIPECNADHLDVVKEQGSFANGGFIVTNANCSTTGIALPLKVLDNAFGLEQVIASTYQAISGAGYPGVPSLDILGNIVPYIKGEEEKMESELAKILGSLDNGKITNSNIQTMVNCARVPVVDGHLESLILRTSRDASVEEIEEVMEEFRGEPQELQLPSAPLHPIIVRHEADRPQPALDVLAGEPARARGMSAVVGRVRKKENYIKMFVLSHNTLRGGAGGSVLNAELTASRGLL